MNKAKLLSKLRNEYHSEFSEAELFYLGNLVDVDLKDFGEMF